MTYFVDTSAFYAVLDKDDASHSAARREWERLLRNGADLRTTSYVLVETLALVQHRLGMAATRVFRNDIEPLLSVEWIGADLHEVGAAAVLTAGRKGLSVVDCVSFATMRKKAIMNVFAFDKHFAEQGFTLLPKLH